LNEVEGVVHAHEKIEIILHKHVEETLVQYGEELFFFVSGGCSEVSLLDEEQRIQLVRRGGMHKAQSIEAQECCGESNTQRSVALLTNVRSLFSAREVQLWSHRQCIGSHHLTHSH
jgi:hypothetical protein